MTRKLILLLLAVSIVFAQNASYRHVSIRSTMAKFRISLVLSFRASRNFLKKCSKNGFLKSFSKNLKVL